MRCKLSLELKNKVGLNEKNFNKAGLSKVDKETGIVHFFPAKSISKNFSTHIKDYHNFNFSEKKKHTPSQRHFEFAYERRNGSRNKNRGTWEPVGCVAGRSKRRRVQQLG